MKSKCEEINCNSSWSAFSTGNVETNEDSSSEDRLYLFCIVQAAGRAVRHPTLGGAVQQAGEPAVKPRPQVGERRHLRAGERGAVRAPMLSLLLLSQAVATLYLAIVGVIVRKHSLVSTSCTFKKGNSFTFLFLFILVGDRT